MILSHRHNHRNQLRLNSLEEHPVLISESTWQSKENRERLLELAFEGWGAPAYYTVDKNVLTAFSVGKGTAMVLDVGEDVTSCMPIYDGFVIRKGKVSKTLFYMYMCLYSTDPWMLNY